MLQQMVNLCQFEMPLNLKEWKTYLKEMLSGNTNRKSALYLFLDNSIVSFPKGLSIISLTYGKNNA